jgi:putative transposase
MPFKVIYYHVIWATRYREPLITDSLEPIIFDAIARKSIELKSPIHAINGVEDHIHIAVSIAVTCSVADWVKSVKAVSSYAVNNTYPDLDPRFGWQGGYGILTFGQKVLPTVVTYIQNQKTHHKSDDTLDYLEQIDI